MTDLEQILDLLQKTILDERVFQTAHVFQREELPDDPPVEDINSPSIYLKPLDPIVPDSDYYLDFMTLPVQVSVKFEGRADEAEKENAERYAMLQKKYEYFFSLRNIVKKFPTNLGTLVFKVDAKETKVNLPATGELLEADRARPEQIIHRTGLTLHFQTAQAFAT